MLIKFNRASVLGFGEVILIPGVNNVTPEFWALAKADPVIQGKLESGELEVIGEESPEPVDSIRDLTRMNAATAEKTVKEMVSKELLGAWKEKEKRAKVVKAIDAQLKELSEIEFREGHNP